MIPNISTFDLAIMNSLIEITGVNSNQRTDTRRLFNTISSFGKMKFPAISYVGDKPQKFNEEAYKVDREYYIQYHTIGQNITVHEIKSITLKDAIDIARESFKNDPDHFYGLLVKPIDIRRKGAYSSFNPLHPMMARYIKEETKKQNRIVNAYFYSISNRFINLVKNQDNNLETYLRENDYIEQYEDLKNIEMNTIQNFIIADNIIKDNMKQEITLEITKRFHFSSNYIKEEILKSKFGTDIYLSYEYDSNFKINNKMMNKDRFILNPLQIISTGIMLPAYGLTELYFKYGSGGNVTSIVGKNLNTYSHPNISLGIMANGYSSVCTGDVSRNDFDAYAIMNYGNSTSPLNTKGVYYGLLKVKKAAIELSFAIYDEILEQIEEEPQTLKPLHKGKDDGKTNTKDEDITLSSISVKEISNGEPQEELITTQTATNEWALTEDERQEPFPQTAAEEIPF